MIILIIRNDAWWRGWCGDDDSADNCNDENDYDGSCDTVDCGNNDDNMSRTRKHKEAHDTSLGHSDAFMVIRVAQET